MVKIVLTTKKGILDRILIKLSLILIGILITSIIFATCSKYLQVWGVWLGILINGLLTFCGFYYTEKGTKIRTITWSILITTIAIILIFTIGISLITILF